MLESIIINPPQSAKLSVIWLHGLGADGNDFASAVPYLNVPQEVAIRYVFPHAPVRPVTVNMGMQMRAWYDILNPVIGHGQEDESGIEQSYKLIVEMIEHENEQGISTNRIVLAGFSQGGAVALYSAIRYPHSLAGILAISTYLPMPEKTLLQRHSANQNIPILYLHGTLDPLISIQTAQTSRQVLVQNDYRVTSKDYPIAHTVAPQELIDIGQWLTDTAVSQADS